MKKHIIKGILALSLAGGQAVAASAQEQGPAAQGFTPAAKELLKEQRLWFNSLNAAGTVFDDTRNYSDVKVGYDLTGGNFHRPQQGDKEKNFSLGSEGFMNLKSAYVWGNFSFNQKNVEDAQFNASIADPFRVMPYYVADTNKSKWRNQYYNLQFRAATPLYWNRVAFGLTGRYVATLAAKQRDPRVDTRFYTLELTPGVTFAINEKHSIGADFEYSSIKEDSQMSNVNASVDQDYYELYGLGMATKGLGAGRSTNYYGDRAGGSVQYGYTDAGLRMLIEGGFSKRVENVDISFSTPKKDASVKENAMHVSVNVLATGKKFTHNFKTGYYLSNADGIQYLNQRDNSSAQSGWITLWHGIRSTYQHQDWATSYAFICNRGDEYSWKFEADMLYTKQNDKYLLPLSTMVSEHFGYGLSIKRNQPLGRKLMRRLLICLSAHTSKNYSGSYNYGGSHADYPTVTEMMTRDENYLTSDYYRLGASLTYSQQYREGQKTHLFAKAGFDYVKTSNYDFDHRSVATLSLGINF